MDDKKGKRVLKTKRTVIEPTNKSSEELFDEIMRRKQERKIKRDIRNNTIRIDQLRILNIRPEDEENKDEVLEEKDVNTKIIDNQEIAKIEEKIKVLPPSYISEITETIDITDIINKTKKGKFKIYILFSIFVLIISIFVISLFVPKEELVNNVTVLDIKVNEFDNETVTISIEPRTKQKECYVSEEIVDDVSLLEFIPMEETCDVRIKKVKNYVYFKDAKDIISDALELNNYIVNLEVKDNIYVALGAPVNLIKNLDVIGDVDIVWNSLEGEVNVVDNQYVSNVVDTKTLIAMSGGKKVAETKVYTTDVIVNKPMEFDKNKPFISCKQFTLEQAQLLDQILLSRIEDAGFGTRAGAVAAARFLTLEFPYRIAYFFENGRLNNTGIHFADGEGRYYHKGLYLDETKYDDIVASFVGPAMWGCNLAGNSGNYTPGKSFPNGIDCSGFVSWSLLNGGFDVGDYGAGPLSGKDLTDFGDRQPLNNKLIESGKIKVGDLFSLSGHIGILIGMDDDYFYIAESLNTYKGLVISKRTKQEAMSYFTGVVLMDKLYNGDGKLTDMWY